MREGVAQSQKRNLHVQRRIQNYSKNHIKSMNHLDSQKPHGSHNEVSYWSDVNAKCKLICFHFTFVKVF